MFRGTIIFSVCYFFMRRLMKFSSFHNDMKRLNYTTNTQPIQNFTMTSKIDDNEEFWGHFVDIDIYS